MRSKFRVKSVAIVASAALFFGVVVPLITSETQIGAVGNQSTVTTIKGGPMVGGQSPVKKKTPVKKAPVVVVKKTPVVVTKTTIVVNKTPVVKKKTPVVKKKTPVVKKKP